jgi:hypothetical protein
MTEVIKQFNYLDDALWFIDSEGSDAEVYDKTFSAEIVRVNKRWRVTIQAEVE